MALGVDIGGTKIKVGLVDSSGCLAAHFQYAKEKSKLSDFTKDLQKELLLFCWSKTLHPANYVLLAWVLGA